MNDLRNFLAGDSSPKEVKKYLDQYRLPGNRSVLKNLNSLTARLASQPDADEFLRQALEHIRETAHPEQALNQLERFLLGMDNPEGILSLLIQSGHALRTLCIVFGASPFLGNILIQQPDLLIWLTSDRIWRRPADRESLVKEMLDACRGIRLIEETYPILRQVKRREMLRIGAKDLTGFADFSETVEGLTTLAEAALETAYRVADRFMKKRYGTPQLETVEEGKRECPFVILGMGKLGGEELNFSSDIDLLYLYESDGGETTGVPDAADGTQGKVDNHIYFVRLCERITDMMHANTEDGFVFRVDLRLRPEGAQGPVASSLRTYELYYESFGQTWERSAHLKCRPVAGDLDLGRRFTAMLRPFVYRKYLDYAAIGEIKEMKQKILQELAQRPARGYNVKLGRGGIREVEFFVQSLQLLYGGRTTWVRETNSLRALHRLCDKEIITYEDYSTLSQAYIFLRNVEHKLQIENQLQTQTMPEEPGKLDRLARRCGWTDRKAFRKELAQRKKNVENLFEQLFYVKPTDQGPDRDSPLQAIAWGIAESEEACRHLETLGFSDPLRAYKNIQMLREGAAYRHTSSRCRSLFLKAAPPLIQEIGASPDPDMALNHLERFVSEYHARETFYELLAKNPEALQRIVSLFSISSYLSNLLIRHPGSIEVLFSGDLLEHLPSRTEYLQRISEGLQSLSPAMSPIDFLRRFKHMEEMRIGLWDILKKPDVLLLSRALSRLADACLETAFSLALGEMTEPFGTPQDASGDRSQFAILGAGKLGSRELTYGADLDLLFVYSEDGETSGPEKISNRDFFSRLAGRLVSILSSLTGEGVVYRIDMRLRPLGDSGPLVQSVEGYRNYFTRSLQDWERQALTRARFCAGDKTCGETLLSLIEETLFLSPPPPGLKESVRDMRKRIEQEKASPRKNRIHFKTGAGGLIDIEFIVQYLQLCFGHEHPEIRFLTPLQVLETASKEGLLPFDDFQSLKKAYLFLRRLESRARIVQDLPITSLAAEPEKNRSLALRMGYKGKGTHPGESLLRDLGEIARQIRAIFLRFLALETPEKD